MRLVIITVLVLLLLCSLSAISAEDNMGSVLNFTDNQESPILAKNVNSIENSHFQYKSSMPNNFTSLNNLIQNAKPNEQINLTCDVNKLNSEFSTFKDGILIKEKNITINGNGHKINANNNGRIFYLSNNANLILNNISLINGNACGGAIYCAVGSLTLLDNVKFINNSAIGTNLWGGGAIYLYSRSTLNINGKNIYFINNYASKSLDWGGGGAIYLDHSCNLNMAGENIFFINNTIDSSNNYGGGAIAMNDGNVLDITGKNIQFINNSATSDGAVIFHNKNDNTLRFRGSNLLFINNKGRTALFYASINNAVFLNNSFIRGHNIYGYSWDLNRNYWGCVENPITLGYASGKISEWIIPTIRGYKNIARNVPYKYSIKFNQTNLGNSINHASLADFYITVTINNNVYKKVLVHEGEANFTLSVENLGLNNIIVKDSVTNNILLRYTVNALIDYTFFALNHTINANNNSLIVLNNDYYYDHLFDSNFTNGVIINRNLTIDGSGHRISGSNLNRIFSVKDSVSLKLVNITLTQGNSLFGGAVYLEGFSYLNILNNVQFINNTATNEGGAIYSQNGNLTIDGSNILFESNNAKISGGAINVHNLIIKGWNIDFINNVAESGNGGAIEVNKGSVSNVLFMNNVAGSTGQTIYNNGELLIENCNFNNTNYTNDTLIYNNGNLFLRNNTMVSVNKEKIYNNGLITSPINLIILNNTVTYGEKVLLSTYLTDDNHNKIIGQQIRLFNDIYGFFNLTILNNGIYGYEFTPYQIGIFSFNGTYSGGSNLRVHTGRLIVNKLNSTININVEDIVYGNSVIITGFVNGVDSSVVMGTVNITVNDVNYTVNLINGHFYKIIHGLNAENYRITAIFNGNEKYSPSTCSNYFTVSKANVSMVVSAEDIVFGSDVLISGTVTGVNGSIVNGEIQITIDNANYAINLVNGNFSLVIPNLGAGNYTVSSTFHGNENYNSITVVNNFIVSKANATMTVTVNDVVFGSDVLISGTVTGVNGSVVDGIVQLTVNDVGYTFTLVNGRFSLVIPDLGAGNYTVLSSFLGNGNYNRSSVVSYFAVSKANVTMVVSVNDVVFGFDVLISGTVTGVNGSIVNGEIQITIDNANYAINLVNGNFSLVIPDLGAGDYTVLSSFLGNENYNSITVVNNFIVSKANATMTVTVNDVVFGSDVLISGTVTGVNGSVVDGIVQLTVNDVGYTVTLVNGRFSLVVSGLNAGNYTVLSTFLGNRDYNGLTVVNNFTVSKANATMTVTVNDIVFGQAEVISGTVTGVNGSVVDGIVQLTVNDVGYTVTLVNGRFNLVVPGLNAGNYTVLSTFLGNRDYNRVSIVNYFTVSKTNAIMVVSAEDIVFGSDALISGTVTGVNGSIVNGEIQITINNANYAINLVNGNFSLVIPNLGAGNYTVLSTFPGNENYNAITVTNNFTVSKANVTMVVSVNDVVFGSDVLISGTVTGVNGSVVDGIVQITLNGIDYIVSLVDSKFNQVLHGLNRGNYTVLSSFLGNGNYNRSSVVSYFAVSKANVTMVVSVNDIVFGQGEVISGSATGVNGSVVDGVVQITVNDVGYTVTLVNGRFSLVIPNLGAGNYTVLSSFLGNKNYNAITVTNNFTVSKTNVTMTVSPVDIVFGSDVLISGFVTGVNGSVVDGIVQITVNDVGYTVTLVNGRFNLVVSGLNARNYTVSSIFLGNRDYNGLTVVNHFTVSKTNVSMVVSVNDVVFGSDVLISGSVTGVNGSVVDGVVQLTVNDVGYTVTLVNGRFNLVVSGLNAGKYTVLSSFLGNENYNAITVTNNFTVSKANVSMVVSAEDIVFGSDVLISGTVTSVNGSIVNGEIQITIDNANYAINLVNGNFSLVIPDLGAGNYTVLSSFLGNGNYNKSSVVNNFTVSKANATMTVTVNDVVFGSDALISGTVTGVNGLNMDGIIQIIVNGVDYTVNLVNGRFNHTVSGLNTGNYTVLVGLSNRNYNGLTVNSTFRVKPCLSELLINMNSVFLNEPIGFNLTIATATNVSANGNISVHILDLNGNVIYSSLININKSFNKISLPALDKTGNYSISITFSGYNFISSNTSCNFRVVEFFSLVANDLILYYHNGSTFQVLLTHGSLPVANEKIYLFINGVNYARGTDEKGYAYLNINLLPGKYRISISYQNITIIRTVTVLSTVQCSDLVKYYCNASQFYASFVDNNGNPLRNSKVQFYINGVTYNRFTDNHGIAFLNINLLPGIYKISSTNLINNQTCYNNVHVLSTIHSDNVIKYYKNRTHYNIQIFDDNGKPAINRIVSILINGILYKKVTDSSGIAKLNINLIPGEYKAIVTDLKNNLRVSNNIKVLPKITSNDVISIKDNPCLSKVKLLDDRGFPAINKKIKLNINGVFYYKHTDNNGIAIFELNLKPGTYTATAYYEENAVSNRIFISG